MLLDVLDLLLGRFRRLIIRLVELQAHVGAVPNYAARWLAAYDEGLALGFHSNHAPVVRDELLVELSIL